MKDKNQGCIKDNGNYPQEGQMVKPINPPPAPKKSGLNIDFSDVKKTIDELVSNQNVSVNNKVETKVPKLSLTINVGEEDYFNDMEFLKRTMKATDLCSFIYDFQRYIYSIWDGDRELTEDQHKLIDEIYEKWFEELDNNGIKLEEIYS